MTDGKHALDPALVKALERVRRGNNAPFGRIGARLGFRWIMPIGTLPLPFHPWIARALPFLVAALIAYRLAVTIAGQSGGVGWPALLIVAALIGVVMSVPIANWVGMAFRGPLLQALLIGGAMVLIASDVWAGVAPGWLAVLPAGFVLLFVVQRLGGPVYLRSIERANAAFEPCAPGDRPVVVEHDTVASDYGGWLFRNTGLAQVASRKPPRRGKGKIEERTHFRLSPEDFSALAARIATIRPEGWHARDGCVTLPGLLIGDAVPILVKTLPLRAPLWLIEGRLSAVTIHDGETTQRLIGGDAAVVGRWPLFVCLYWMAIFGGTSRWYAGFIREKPVNLGPSRHYDLLLAAFPPDPQMPCYADPAPLHARLDALDRIERPAAQAHLDWLLSGEGVAPENWVALLKRPDAAFGHGEALCARLAEAKAGKQADVVRICAQLIAHLPADEFVALADTLLTLLNSKELGFRLLGGTSPDVLDLPERERRQHVIGGYSLVRHVPRLYERLGELGEQALPLVTAMGDLGRWPAPLVKARDSILAGREP